MMSILRNLDTETLQQWIFSEKPERVVEILKNFNVVFAWMAVREKYSTADFLELCLSCRREESRFLGQAA